jgi:two-component system sensor histidine kinase BaeS
MADREPSDNDWLEWNLGRDRANPLIGAHASLVPPVCTSEPAG